MSKFKVSVRKVDGASTFNIYVTNRAGREWRSRHPEGDLGNAAERAMVLQELLDSGATLNQSGWVEVPR